MHPWFPFFPDSYEAFCSIFTSSTGSHSFCTFIRIGCRQCCSHSSAASPRTPLMHPWFPFFPHLSLASAIFTLHMSGQLLEGAGSTFTSWGQWVPTLAAMRADIAIKERQGYPMEGVLMDACSVFQIKAFYQSFPIL